MKSIPWTEKEIEILKANFPHENSVDVAAMIGRTTFAISHKAKRLGIKKSETFSKSVKSGKFLKKVEINCFTCHYHDLFVNQYPCNRCMLQAPYNKFYVSKNASVIPPLPPAPEPEKVIPQKSILKAFSNFFKRSAV